MWRGFWLNYLHTPKVNPPKKTKCESELQINFAHTCTVKFVCEELAFKDSIFCLVVAVYDRSNFGLYFYTIFVAQNSLLCHFWPWNTENGVTIRFCLRQFRNSIHVFLFFSFLIKFAPFVYSSGSEKRAHLW